MSVTRDYRMNVIPRDEAMDIMGYTNPDSFKKTLQYHKVEYDHGHGRKPSMFSINALKKLADEMNKEICIPDEFYEKCVNSVINASDIVKSEPQKPSEDWMAKAEKLGWLLNMDAEAIIDLALNRLRDDVVKGFFR